MNLARLAHTSSFRLTLLYAALFTLSALILLSVIYWAAPHYMTRELDSTVQSDVNELAEGFSIGGTAMLAQLVDDRTHEMPSGPIFYLVEDGAGRRKAGNLPAMTPRTGIYDLTVPGALFPGDAADPLRAHGVRLGDGGFLLVAADAHQLVHMKRLVLRTFGWGFAITLLLALAGGAVMSGSVLSRVEAMGRASRDIMEGSLAKRIPVRGSDDEFDRLAESLNAMLDKTQSSLEGMRQVSNDIAHDLRTPLTRLRQRLELGRRRSQSVEELRSAIDRSIADTDAILETFSAVLRISQLEGASKERFTQVDLSELLASVADLYQPAAEEKQQRLCLAVAPALRVAGDRELLAQLFANLIENAVRHSPAGAAIQVEAARRGDGGVEAVIADTGPGIPAAEREKVFRRFYRLETSRTTPGNGLGLSLAAAIASLHGIAIELGDNHPGLRVALHFSA